MEKVEGRIEGEADYILTNVECRSENELDRELKTIKFKEPDQKRVGFFCFAQSQVIASTILHLTFTFLRVVRAAPTKEVGIHVRTC